LCQKRIVCNKIMFTVKYLYS